MSKKIEKLTKQMMVNSGVLYMKGLPGTAKTAVWKAIAKEKNLLYIDFRLSQVDEVEVIGKPETVEYKGMKCMKFIPPEYLMRANDAKELGFNGALIVYDEMNRARLPVRNAALQILNERRAGSFELEDFVHFVALGNLGEEDGCDVEELDAALNNRLIHHRWELTLPDWITDYAKSHIHPHVIGFLESNPSYFHRKPQDSGENGQSDAYCTARSWTFLSDYIVNNFGMKAGAREYISDISEIAHEYVGANAARRLIRYVQEKMTISIKDVIKDYKKVQKDLNESTRDRKSELLGELKEVELWKLTEKEASNVSEFLRDIDADERVGFFNQYIDKIPLEAIKGNVKLKEMLREFSGEFKKINKMSGVDAKSGK
jgi:hypothetical protein